MNLGAVKKKYWGKGRKNNKARSPAIYLVRDLSGATFSKVDAYFGGVSGAVITVRYNKIVSHELSASAR